ncbi:MAG: hypothetical protein KatS3mg050_3874 [Litorilinea sp.]|nr:MAG: hypothetical protein KatS3mg050_3874 [Litorilinea sp.]
MYHHPGEYVTDFCIVERRGLYHLFHIRGERWTWPLGYKELDLGHAVSKDLRTWHPREPVLPAGPPGSWDATGIWAPDIIQVGETYYMFYTGADEANNQAIGLATSTDLFTWEKYAGNPLVVPGPWSDRHVGHDVAGRDAMVFADTDRGRYLMYYTATLADGRACIALAQSQDLLHWEDLGPTYVEEDRSYDRLESAYLVPHGGRYYLFYSAKGGPKSKGFPPQAFAHFDIVYLVSDDPTGGWVKPANHELLTGWTCASEHPTFGDTTYMLYIIQEELGGIWGASTLSDPKRMVWQPDGTVRIHEYVPEGVAREALFTDRADGYTGWVRHGEGWQAWRANLMAASSPGEDSYLMNTLWGTDLALEAQVQAGPDGVASLLVRSNPSALAGYRISLDFGRGVVGFYRSFPGAPDQPLQERPVTLSGDAFHRLKVVVQGKFFEIYVDEALTIVRDEATYPEGCFGLHARGQARFQDVRAYRYVDAEGEDPTWHRRCTPRHLFPSQ